ncbi:MAG: vitamin K epoxide reductase, partial [Chloroflexi bacterium]|nr:vitamin K epoxide reductase [Chloroflexota bacterium]
MTGKKTALFICLLFILLILAVAPVCGDGEGPPVVRAILFHSPNCPHCHAIITQVLPPLQDEHGEQLQVLLADTSTPEGHVLYEQTAEYFRFERRVVPILGAGDVVLTGGQEIPQSLPGLIEQGLAAGGVDWPAIPGFV